MNVAAIIARKGGDVITVDQNASLADAARILDQYSIGAVIILDSVRAPAGVLSERDITRAVARMGAAALTARVADCMTRDVVTCRAGDTLEHLMGMMTDRRIRHLPVMDGEMLIGVISIGDLVKQRIAEAEADAQAMKSYIAAG